MNNTEVKLIRMSYLPATGLKNRNRLRQLIRTWDLGIASHAIALRVGVGLQQKRGNCYWLVGFAGWRQELRKAVGTGHWGLRIAERLWAWGYNRKGKRLNGFEVQAMFWRCSGDPLAMVCRSFCTVFGFALAPSWRVDGG